MAHTIAWDETAPAGTQYASTIDDWLRDTKRDIRERLELNHVWNSSTTHDGKHTKITLRPANNVTVFDVEAANSLTGSSYNSFMNIAQTWDTTGCPTLISAAVTDTASDADSLLVNILVNGSSKFQVTKAGVTTVGGLGLPEWTAPAFSAGNFSGSGSMTWTLVAGDVDTCAYMLLGKLMVVSLALKTTSVGGTLDTYLRYAIPGGQTSKRIMVTPCVATDNGAVVSAKMFVSASAAYVYIGKSDGTAWSASTDNTLIQGTIWFEVT